MTYYRVLWLDHILGLERKPLQIFLYLSHQNQMSKIICYFDHIIQS